MRNGRPRPSDQTLVPFRELNKCQAHTELKKKSNNKKSITTVLKTTANNRRTLCRTLFAFNIITKPELKKHKRGI